LKREKEEVGQKVFIVLKIYWINNEQVELKTQNFENLEYP